MIAKQAHGTGAVAGNLGHDLVRIGHGDTAVASRDHAHVVGSHVIASRGKLAAQTLGRIDRRISRRHDAGPRNGAIRLRNRSLRGRRAYVDTNANHGILLLCGKAAVPLPRSSYRVSIKAAMRVSIWPMSPLL